MGLALAIFLIDALTPLEGAVAVLYVVVMLIAARAFRSRGVIAMATVCITLTVAAYLPAHGLLNTDAALVRALVSLAAIAIGTALALRNQAAAERLAEQASLLDLTHDSIFVRDRGDIVRFWNRGAEELYGFRADEALGRNVHELLRTVFPMPREAIRGELRRTGRWEGELVQTVRSGRTAIVESRWALQRDARGEPVSVLETNTDITERRRAHEALVESERRYRTIFDTTRVSILQQDWTPVKAALDDLAGTADVETYLAEHPDFVRRMRQSVRIVDLNAVTLRLLGADSKTQALCHLDDILPEDEPTFPRALLAIARGETFYEGESQIRTRSGELVPILFGITFPPDVGGYGCVLVFAVDISERKEAQATLLALQAELAHALRVSTLGELTASIAHEVNQPLAAIVTNGEAALRWLRRPVPDLEEAQAALMRVVSNGTRAGDIVSRIRSFLNKAPTLRERIDLVDMIDEALLLIEQEMMRHGVVPRREIKPDLPEILGDRVQLQQVVINLMVNGIQAMAGVSERPRVLTIQASCDGKEVGIAVIDSGTGIAPEIADSIFKPFVTTKGNGMGMGLAICRTTIEAHGGRLWIGEASGPGAAFHLTVPVTHESIA
ncbi:PAS domain-containing sensor histidine kinase [Methylobacterium durans]|uniref:PAS domain-containing sensor histidine kinase n=1 Tax=Methylobacterium durans TaxID=2202825 RepID=UPI001F3C20D5|nr:ATP-binding protein [Methylobacterium durans]